MMIEGERSRGRKDDGGEREREAVEGERGGERE